ncbi:MAG: ATP-binding protein [Bifidobacterium bifidum]|nr:ATP-binding protein [Bifidobacterium bifidum]
MTLLGEPLNEIAHNIIRHCPAGCEFDCSVILHDDVAEVTQYNSVTHPADKSETAVSTHMGLGLYRDRLLHIGGMLRTEVEDGTWMLYARVPLTHQT